MLGSELVAEFYTGNGKALRSPTSSQETSRHNYLAYLEECGSYISQNGSLDEGRVELGHKNITDF